MDFSGDEIVSSNGSKGYLLKGSTRPENFNFHDYFPRTVSNHLVIEGSWSDDFTPFLSTDIRGLSLVSEGAGMDMSFVPEYFPNTEVLFIQGDLLFGHEVIKHLKRLEYISLSLKSNQPIRFELPGSLKSFVCTWNNSYEITRFPVSVEYMLFEKARTFDFSGMIPPLENLLKVELLDSTVNDGAAFLELPKLRYLALTKCKINLKRPEFTNESIKYINLHKVEIENWDWLGVLKGLDVLILEDCGSIQTLKPLSASSGLRGLWVSGNTKIADGDWSFLSSFSRLKNLFIRDYHHYSHKSLVPWSWKRFNNEKTAEPLFKMK